MEPKAPSHTLPKSTSDGVVRYHPAWFRMFSKEPSYIKGSSPLCRSGTAGGRPFCSIRKMFFPRYPYLEKILDDPRGRRRLSNFITTDRKVGIAGLVVGAVKHFHFLRPIVIHA